MENQYLEETGYGKPPYFYYTNENFCFSPTAFARLSQGVSKIGPTHQITLSSYPNDHREVLAEIRWIEFNAKNIFSLGYQLKKLMT